VFWLSTVWREIKKYHENRCEIQWKTDCNTSFYVLYYNTWTWSTKDRIVAQRVRILTLCKRLKSLPWHKNQSVLSKKVKKRLGNTIFPFKIILPGLQFNFWGRQSNGRLKRIRLKPKNIKIGALNRKSSQIPVQRSTYFSPFRKYYIFLKTFSSI